MASIQHWQPSRHQAVVGQVTEPSLLQLVDLVVVQHPLAVGSLLVQPEQQIKAMPVGQAPTEQALVPGPVAVAAVPVQSE